MSPNVGFRPKADVRPMVFSPETVVHLKLPRKAHQAAGCRLPAAQRVPDITPDEQAYAILSVIRRLTTDERLAIIANAQWPLPKCFR